MSKSKFFDISKDNKIKRTKKSCKKCGEGFFMGKHKDRYTCGNCSYTEKK